MAFLEGIKNSLKLDQVGNEVASKLNSARTFIHQQQESLGDHLMKSGAGPAVKMVKEKVFNLMPHNLTSYFGGLVKFAPGASGKQQSPVDIVSSLCIFDESLVDSQFTLSYFSEDAVELVNTGHSWQINMKVDSRSVLEATHLNSTYKLRQIHCHWGTEPMNGSEHIVGGVGYAGELHYVHWNLKYGTIEEALKFPDGIAVLGIFLNETHDDNPNFESLVKMMSKIPYKNETLALNNGFNFMSFIPAKLEYWTYEGSLTTPPYTECVVWTVFRAAIPISSRQLDAFRSLYTVAIENAETTSECRMLENVRPVQALNGRIVRSSFKAGGVAQ
uniref:Alpha-carbonic anhydrase domain-containing protein n=1 Tax=Romanomermis culicivorax TaxID=13658 RepID=A0A915JS19_ROMCU